MFSEMIKPKKADTKKPEQIAVQVKVDVAKARMYAIRDDASLSKAEKMKKLTEIVQNLKKETEMSDELITSTLTPEFFAPSLKRRITLEEALKAKNLTLEDGFTQNESNNESTLNLEQNEKYWSQFWSAYGVSYKKETPTNPDQVKHILEQGYDFFIGIPDISPQQLREICQKEGLKVYENDEQRLELPTLNRTNLPTSNYLLALKLTKEIARYEREGDTQLQTNSINFEQATQIATDLGLRGLTYKEYLIAQLYYFKSTGTHLDKDSWTWLIDQRAPSAGDGAYGDFRDGEVVLLQYGLSDAFVNGGVRLSDIL